MEERSENQSAVFITYCPRINHHMLSRKQHPRYLSLCRLEVWAQLSRTFSSGSHKGAVNMSARLFLPGAQGSPLSSCACWQSPTPCSYRTEVPILLLAVSRATLGSWQPCMPSQAIHTTAHLPGQQTLTP